MKILIFWVVLVSLTVSSLVFAEGTLERVDVVVTMDDHVYYGSILRELKKGLLFHTTTGETLTIAYENIKDIDELRTNPEIGVSDPVPEEIVDEVIPEEPIEEDEVIITESTEELQDSDEKIAVGVVIGELGISNSEGEVMIVGTVEGDSEVEVVEEIDGAPVDVSDEVPIVVHQVPQENVRRARPRGSRGTGLKVTGWVFVGLGIAGGVIGAFSYMFYDDNYNSYDCRNYGNCERDEGQKEFATNSLIVGGLFLAGGVVMVLVGNLKARRYRRAMQAERVSVTPVISPELTGLQFKLSF